MAEIYVVNSGRSFSFEPGKNLMELLLGEGIFIDNPCNGKGLCGKCKVRILEGDAGEISAHERRLLNEKELATGVRLSCMAVPRGYLSVELLKGERKHEVLTTGYLPDFKIQPSLRKELIEIPRPTLDGQKPWEERLHDALPGVAAGPEIIRESSAIEGPCTAVIRDGADGAGRLFALEAGDTRELLFGVAIDIGTTTVVTSLVDIKTGRELADASMINAQKRYGLDVLTRITYELEEPECGIKRLQSAIVDSISDMIDDVCSQAGVQRENIYEITVAANCTMLHMLLGVDAKPIGRAPYAPAFVGAAELPSEEIGLKAARGAVLYCLPSVSAYIGADIVAGAYVCGLHSATGSVLFIDIGTNGEIVLSDRGRLLCCSCAAGPALEGMNISSGMRASDGAIEEVRIGEKETELKVIGGESPAGLCGSGILSVVSELVRTGIVGRRGAFLKPEKLASGDYRAKYLRTSGTKREFVLSSSPELLVTQGDVRQVQLAKGAILSGFYALLKKAGKEMKDLDSVMIAGQFGAHLPAESLIGSGILPEEVRGRLVYVGNSSKTGAYMALLSKEVKAEMSKLAREMEYLELGAAEGYERLFADCLMFPPAQE